MINFSKLDTIPNLIADIEALPTSSTSCDEVTTSLAKQVAVSQLQAVQSATINGASINLRANIINSWRQLECQIAGQVIKASVAPAAAPLTSPTPTTSPVATPTEPPKD